MFHFIPRLELRTRQNLLLNKLPNSQALLMLSNQTFFKNSDTEFRFRQDSNFWYFTGFDEDCSAVLFVEGKIILFAKEKDPEKEIWTGQVAGLEKAKELVCADEVYPFESLADILELKTAGLKKIYFDVEGNSYVILRQNLQKIFLDHKLEMEDESEITSQLRIFKSTWEVDQIQKACDISILAHQRVDQFLIDYTKSNLNQNPNRFPFSNNLSSLSENHLQGILNYSFNEFKAIAAYPPIIVSGQNATVLHYWQNTADIHKNQVILIDAACEYNYYSSDITRCYSLDRFNSAQQAIYNLVLKTNLMVIEMAKTFLEESISLSDLQAKSVEMLTEGLIGLGILKGDLEENIENKSYKKFYMHSISHWLGLDTHDVGKYKNKNSEPRILDPGMAFTVEPGLYFKEDDDTIPAEFRGIGIRIEDDIFLSETGLINLTEKLVK